MDFSTLSLADRLRRLAPEGLLTFGLVGCTGLLVDTTVFTLAHQAGAAPAWARALSLAVATMVTWRLNRRFTFAPSLRGGREELGRYAVVTVGAQGLSYALFLMFTALFAGLAPQACLVAAALIAAGASFAGQRFFTFAPTRTATEPRP